VEPVRLIKTRMRLYGLLTTLALAVGLTVAASLTARVSSSPAAADPGPYERLSAGGISAGIGRLQRHLRAQPRDAGGWATLGLSYVEQARLTADPSYYPKAEAALGTALKERPADNDTAHAGLAALAAARHDFATALTQADQALAINPYGQNALAVRVDALVELGRYSDAMTAAEHADAVAPGTPIFTRLAYVNELYGHVREARRILDLAAASATGPGDQAYVHDQLGELAWNSGHLTTAAREFGLALCHDPSSLPAVDGRSRVRAARGDVAGAVADHQAVVATLPLPQYLTGFGELLDARGHADQAARQYAVAGAWATLAKAGGVATDLETALFDADHGDHAQALRAARAEWDRRHSVHVADALGWALHANGRDAEALTYAGKANATGYRNASFRYHLGMIEKALGKRDDARRDLAGALALNKDFSPLYAPRARAALASLGGRS
jgi:tetratricopeptide (TPR) repeat protein